MDLPLNWGAQLGLSFASPPNPGVSLCVVTRKPGQLILLHIDSDHEADFIGKPFTFRFDDDLIRLAVGCTQRKTGVPVRRL